MTEYESEIWRNMIDKTLERYKGRLESLTFYVEVTELYDKRGNVYSDKLPRLAINFK